MQSQWTAIKRFPSSGRDLIAICFCELTHASELSSVSVIDRGEGV